MAIPIVYNLRSMKVRWTSAIVAILGIAGTVGVFVAVLALSRGFQSTVISSGQPGNALVLRAGSTSELSGAIALSQVKVIENAPGVARTNNAPLVSPEVVTTASFPLRSENGDANVQIRGVSPKALEVRSNIKMVKGRFLQAGLSEVVIGRNVTESYAGVDFGRTVEFGGRAWQIVGVFDAGGSAFDSEVWCDSYILQQTYHQPDSMFQSVTVRLTSPKAIEAFKDAITADPRMTVEVSREVDYYTKQSRGVTTTIFILGSIVATIMALGAICGALNTMYSAVAERSREIATMKALGFNDGSVVLSFLFESVFIALLGGVLGCLASLPLNGFTAGTFNAQTYSHLIFQLQVTPAVLLFGILFALVMGVLGGLPPAVGASRRPVAQALRGF
jgi:putative ABC transport system permease protein